MSLIFYSPCRSVRAIFVVMLNRMFRETAEIVADKDYFGIKVSIWGDNSMGTLSALRAQLATAFEDDNLTGEAGPVSTSGAGQISVSIGFGVTGISGEISYSLDFSDIKPRITRTLDLTNDIAHWEMKPPVIGNRCLSGQILIVSATWATPANGETGININFGGSVKILYTEYDSNFRAIHPRYRY